MKSIFSRLSRGCKKGYQYPSLPAHILQLHTNPIIRIFRFLGGVCVILILTKRLSYLPDDYYFFALVICTFFSFLFLLYNIYLTYHRTIHIYNAIKKGDLDIRNSPFDRLGSAMARVILCGKGFCDAIAPLVLLLVLWVV